MFVLYHNIPIDHKNKQIMQCCYNHKKEGKGRVMDYIWWEKTVEYLFVKKYLNQNSIVAPLDGDIEKAGDAIFSMSDKWILIEFKRKDSDINSEKRKFDSYDEAKKALKNNDGHHLIIFGNIDNDGKFQLNCKRYFSDIEVEITKVLTRGTDRKTFCDYITKFANYKLSKKGRSGGGNVDYSHVIGVDESGEAIAIMSPSEFSDQFPADTAELRNILNPEPQSSGPGMNLSM